MDFRLVPGDPVCFGKLLISKQEDDAHQGTRVEQVCNRKETMW